MKFFHLHSSLNAGVLDTRLSTRLDVKQYMKGMAQANNVLCMPQGGVRRRDGLRFVAQYNAPIRPIPFVFNIEQQYVLVFRDQAIDIYRDDALKATINSTYSTAELADIRYAHSADTLILVHEAHAPALLQRQGTDVDWTLTDISFINPPQFRFNDAQSPAGTDEIQDFKFRNFQIGQLMKFNVEGISTDDIAFDTITNMIPVVTAELKALPNLFLMMLPLKKPLLLASCALRWVDAIKRTGSKSVRELLLLAQQMRTLPAQLSRKARRTQKTYGVLRAGGRVPLLSMKAGCGLVARHHYR